MVKLAFVTMVWRDYWLLEKWVAHNSAVVPRDQLYVINHGGDPEIARIADGCNIFNIPREEVTLDLTRRRWDLLGGMANGLLGFYDRVVVTDVDELILYVGDRPGGLIEHLEATEIEGSAIAPVGLNLIPTAEDGTDPEAPVLTNHPNAVLSARYTKPCIVAEHVTYTVGGHGLIDGNFQIDSDLVLVHLHYVTPDYSARMSARKGIVGEARTANEASDDPLDLGRRYWVNWSRPHMIRKKEMKIYARARPLELSQGFGECAELLRNAVRSTGRKTVVDPGTMSEDPARVTLPDRLRQAV